MVAGSFSDEATVALSADQVWKQVFAEVKVPLWTKACAGLIDAVDVDGNGEPGTVNTLKLNPAVAEAEGAKVLKSRLVAKDHAARVVRMEVLEGGKVSAGLKSEVVEMRVEPAGEAACVVKLTIEYERDGGELPPEDCAKLAQGYLVLLKKVEEYLVAHPGEFA